MNDKEKWSFLNKRNKNSFYNSKLRLSSFCMIVLLIGTSTAPLYSMSDIENLNDETFSIQKTVSGIVTDSEGNPLPGVNVIVKGKSIGDSTDFDGAYKLEASDGDVLTVFLYLGFKTQTVTVGPNATLQPITLQEDASELR